jgi:hypothetical protein
MISSRPFHLEILRLHGVNAIWDLIVRLYKALAATRPQLNEHDIEFFANQRIDAASCERPGFHNPIVVRTIFSVTANNLEPPSDITNGLISRSLK